MNARQRYNSGGSEVCTGIFLEICWPQIPAGQLDPGGLGIGDIGAFDISGLDGLDTGQFAVAFPVGHSGLDYFAGLEIAFSAGPISCRLRRARESPIPFRTRSAGFRAF